MRNDRETGGSPRMPGDLRRRLNRRRGLAALKRGLPRVAQAAAAVIAVISIGTGIALATSPQARQWAAGVLQSRVVDPDGWFGEVRSSMTDGAAVDGKLLVVEDNVNISVYEGTDAEPVTYEWRDAGNRRIEGKARHRIAQGLALLHGPVLHEVPRGIERGVVIEQADPQSGEGANAIPRAAICAAHFQEAFQAHFGESGGKMVVPIR